jgi:hypothetical protein
MSGMAAVNPTTLLGGAWVAWFTAQPGMAHQAVLWTEFKNEWKCTNPACRAVGFSTTPCVGVNVPLPLVGLNELMPAQYTIHDGQYIMPLPDFAEMEPSDWDCGVCGASGRDLVDQTLSSVVQNAAAAPPGAFQHRWVDLFFRYPWINNLGVTVPGPTDPDLQECAEDDLSSDPDDHFADSDAGSDQSMFPNQPYDGTDDFRADDIEGNDAGPSRRRLRLRCKTRVLSS